MVPFAPDTHIKKFVQDLSPPSICLYMATQDRRMTAELFVIPITKDKTVLQTKTSTHTHTHTKEKKKKGPKEGVGKSEGEN